jgi:uncharacterized protein (TIGR02996 family)
LPAEQTLLAGDDTYRLILADRLEENGRPKRAQFIIVQVVRDGRAYPWKSKGA